MESVTASRISLLTPEWLPAHRAPRVVAVHLVQTAALAVAATVVPVARTILRGNFPALREIRIFIPVSAKSETGFLL